MVRKKSGNSMLKNLMLFWIFSFFLDAYCFFYIATYPVTTFTIATIIVFLNRVIELCKRPIMSFSSQDKIAGVMLVYLIINYCLLTIYDTSTTYTSLLFSLMYFGMFILLSSNNNLNESDLNDEVEFFQILMDIASIYAIYQFIANVTGLPFARMEIAGHMVEGFNYGNEVSLFGMRVMRSNSIFREPSQLGQVAAINLLFYICGYIIGKKYKHIIIRLIINFAALVVSVSGTGILILLGTGMLYFLKEKKVGAMKSRITLITCAGIIGVIAIMQTSFGREISTRMTEIFTYQENAFSGYVRFRGGWDIFISLISDPIYLIFGTGIGSLDDVISRGNYYYGITANGIYRPLIELGVVGAIIWLSFIISFYRRKGSQPVERILVYILLPYMLCGETFQANSYWIYIYMLCIRHVHISIKADVDKNPLIFKRKVTTNSI